MGSRQRPSGHATSAAAERAAGAEQERHEEQMLSDAREDIDDDESLPGEDPGTPPAGER